MNLPSYRNIDTNHLQRLFDNTAECYKLFWFKAIIEAVCQGKSEITYDELINTMIADAWYMVGEYRLNLGPNDTLEKLVLDASGKLELKTSEKKETIINRIAESTDKEIIKNKLILTYNVPYRLQAPFMPDVKAKAWDGRKEELAQRINGHDGLIYDIEIQGGLQNRVLVRRDWCEYIKANQEILAGWVEFHLIQYLQRRNPSVPGIPNKLYPPQTRKLQRVTAYWNSVLDVKSLREIYGGEILQGKSISIDHFVPWSYVAHDELWNLSPTTKSVNSSKSNHLPEWDSYFRPLCQLEYEAYTTMWQVEKVHREFELCAREHVNSPEVLQKLYRPGLKQNEFSGQLEELLQPIYAGAKSIGFDEWRLS